MAKRRNKQPNLPVDTLQRAREQAGLGAASPTPPVEDAPPAPVSTVPTPVAAAPAAAPRASAPAGAAASARPAPRRRVTATQLERSKQRGELDAAMIEELLAHPTKVVTEAELRAAYQHVLVDLRNMGLLAAVLVIVLIVVAQLL